MTTKWTIPSLQCIEHNANDGLRTSVEGLQHSVLVRVPSGWTKCAISQIQNLNGVWLVVLAACDSGRLLPTNPSGFESVFISKDVPHVITLDRVMNPTPVGYWSDLFWKELMPLWVGGGAGFEVQAAAKKAQDKTLEYYRKDLGGNIFFLRQQPFPFIRYNGKLVEEEG